MGLTHGEDLDVQAFEDTCGREHVILGLAIRHQDQQVGCLQTEPRCRLQVLPHHVVQGQALGAGTK